MDCIKIDFFNFFVIALLIAIVGSFILEAEAGRTPPPTKAPPVVELSAEYIGKAILVKWVLPIEETQNNEAYKWVLQRSINGSAFVDIANGERDPNNKPLEQGQEVNYYLDRVAGFGSVYEYKMFFVSVDGRETTEAQGNTRIEILRDEPQEHISEGKFLQTTRVLVPYNKPLVKAFSFNPIPSAYAPTADLEAIVTSTLNPKNEPYLFSLTPIPNPDPSIECEEILEVLFKPNANGGQSFEIYASIIESQTIVRNQHLFEFLPNSDKRIFNDMEILTEKLIQNYDALEVQLDIDSSTEIDPNNYRSLSIYGINLYVPAVNGAC